MAPKVIAAGLLAAIGLAGWWGWKNYQSMPAAATVEKPVGSTAVAGAVPVRISPQAKANMSLVSSPLKPTTYWRTVEFPGVIVERPGVTRRGVVAPITGVVTKLHAFPGDIVAASAPLATLRLLSDSVYNSQLELFKATKDSEIAQSQIERLNDAAQSGALPKSRLIDVQNELERLTARIHAYRQDLQARGLPAEQIDAAADGEFLTEILMRAPGEKESTAVAKRSAGEAVTSQEPEPFSFEVESLGAELGQQVAAGDVLFNLADHSELLIEGRGFKDDLPLIQTAIKNGWNVEVEFPHATEGDWPEIPHDLPIDHVANAVDPETRTFGFYAALENQRQSYSRNGKKRQLWRFRPGSQLRIRVPVEKFEKAFVVPQPAVVWEGPEAFVFQQDGQFYHRRPAQVLHQDRLFTVLAADAGLRSGDYIAQGAAASLNRVMKSQAQEASGAPAGMHVHPDGTTHAAH
ncbi:MAG: HlyD family efflux transporter periplasmic adaptor subunit [Planctomycetaceae bacterium]|nr:HlyD family efflux transporter periplasmic adaptor subunit [Planctomycetaceae bacterium]